MSFVWFTLENLDCLPSGLQTTSTTMFPIISITHEPTASSTTFVTESPTTGNGIF